LRRSLAFAATIAVACGARPKAPAPSRAELELHVDARDPSAVRVTGHFRGGSSRVLALPDETVPGVTSFEVGTAGAFRRVDPTKIDAPECVRDCDLRYTIDLGKAERSFEGVVSVGDGTFVAPTPAWIAHPDPMPPGDMAITIDGAAEPTDTFTDVGFATGLRRRDATHYFLPTPDYYEGSFAAFGKLRHRKIEVAGATIEIVLVGATKLAMDDAAIAKWIADDAACVAQLYVHFPVPRATIFVVPIEGSDTVRFGKVLSLGGASIIALTGASLPADKTHADWVVVHEMTHLGFPTMGIRWLTEGLATYYEPILRERAGWIDARALWKWFVEQMPRGVPDAGSELALDKRDTIDDIYWGGAIFMLLADVGIRSATDGKKSFDDVMRAVLGKGGDATVAWSLARVLAVAREATGTNVMSDLVQRYGVRGERVDLNALFTELGVVHHGSVTFDDSAPKAAIRRAMERGGH
jgi:hypothetical protein